MPAIDLMVRLESWRPKRFVADHACLHKQLTKRYEHAQSKHAQYLLEIAGRAGKANERVTQVTARQQVMLTWARRFVLEKHLLADERLNARRQALEQARAAQRTRRQAMAAAAHRARHARLAPVTSLDDHRPTPVLVPSASLTLVDDADADEDEEVEGDETDDEDEETDEEDEETDDESDDESPALVPDFEIRVDTPFRNRAPPVVEYVAMTARGGMPGATRPVFQSIENLIDHRPS